MPDKTTAKLLMGLNGCTYIGGTADTLPPVAGTKFVAIQALTATVLDHSVMITTNSYTTDITGFSGDITIPAGVTIYPGASGITLASGTCLAYHG